MVRWARDGRSLFYVKEIGAAANIYRQPIDGGPPKQITLFKNNGVVDFDLSQDGKQLVLNREIDRARVILIRDMK
jgi:Tol biopolymer transport system component